MTEPAAPYSNGRAASSVAPVFPGFDKRAPTFAVNFYNQPVEARPTASRCCGLSGQQLSLVAIKARRAVD